jgi:hypothetical protein
MLPTAHTRCLDPAAYLPATLLQVHSDGQMPVHVIQSWSPQDVLHATEEVDSPIAATSKAELKPPQPASQPKAPPPPPPAPKAKAPAKPPAPPPLAKKPQPDMPGAVDKLEHVAPATIIAGDAPAAKASPGFGPKLKLLHWTKAPLQVAASSCNDAVLQCMFHDHILILKHPLPLTINRQGSLCMAMPAYGSHTRALQMPCGCRRAHCGRSCSTPLTALGHSFKLHSRSYLCRLPHHQS